MKLTASKRQENVHHLNSKENRKFIGSFHPTQTRIRSNILYRYLYVLSDSHKSGSFFIVVIFRINIIQNLCFITCGHFEYIDTYIKSMKRNLERKKLDF